MVNKRTMLKHHCQIRSLSRARQPHQAMYIVDVHPLHIHNPWSVTSIISMFDHTIMWVAPERTTAWFSSAQHNMSSRDTSTADVCAYTFYESDFDLQ